MLRGGRTPPDDGEALRDAEECCGEETEPPARLPAALHHGQHHPVLECALRLPRVLEHRVLILLEEDPIDLGGLYVRPVHGRRDEGSKGSLPDKSQLRAKVAILVRGPHVV